MSDMVKLAEKEIFRMEALRLLNSAVPVGCSRQVLEAALKKLGLDTGELPRELSWLQGKGLVRMEHAENRRLGIERDVYSITSEGMDYLDGTGEDIPGIGVD